MATIKDSKGQVLAHHTTESCLSHYGQAVWVVEDPDPEPGKATWTDGKDVHEIDILKTQGGWLLCTIDDDPRIIGIIWSDGSYYAAYALTKDGYIATDPNMIAAIAGTIRINPSDPDDLGAILM